MAETEVVVSEIECEDGREAGAGDAARTGQTKKEPHSQESSLQKENVSDNGKRKIKEEKPPSKVVIRRLPPTMSKEIFTKEIGPIPEHDYFYFVPGDPYAGTNMGFSRAYINFIHQEDIFSFTETYDNYVFVDSKGQEYPAIVEFALFQRIPKQRTKKRDHMCGSVQSDSAYLMFKENLEASATAKPDVTSKQHFFETDVSTSSPQEATTTPLLEFLKQKRVDKARMRDERREEKKRKDTERKLRLKGKEKKPEGEDEPKDIKLLQPKERKEGSGREPRNGRRNERENRAKENRPREFKNRNKNHPEEKVKIEKRKEEGADKKEVGEKTKDEGVKLKAKHVDDNKEEGGAEESGRNDKKRNSRGEGSKRGQEGGGGGNRGKERRSTTEGGDDKPGDDGGRKGRNERNKSVRKERERRRRENYFAKKGLEKRNGGETNVDDKKKSRMFRNSANGESRQQNKHVNNADESSKSESIPADDRNTGACESKTSSAENQDRTEAFVPKRRGSLEISFDCGEPFSQKNQAKRRNSLESGQIDEGSDSFKGKGPSSREQRSISREMSYEDKRGAESDDGGDKASRSNQEDKASKSDQDDKEKDPRTGRRIRNKDRPSIQIYRPGMGKFSKHRLEKEKTLGSSTEVDSPSHSPSPGPKTKPQTSMASS